MLLGGSKLHLSLWLALPFSHCRDNKTLLMHLGCRCPLAFVSQKEQLKTCQRHCLPCRFVLLSSIWVDVFVHLIFLYHSSFHPEGILREYMLCQGNQGQIGQNETNFIMQGIWQLQQRKEIVEQWVIKSQVSLFRECVYTLHWECTDGVLCPLIAVLWLSDMLLWPWRIRPHKTGMFYT